MGKTSQYVSEYRRVRRNYMQFIRRHEIKDYTPIPLSEKKGKRDLAKLTKEYAKLKKETSQALRPKSVKSEYDRTRANYLRYLKNHPEKGEALPPSKDKGNEALEQLSKEYEQIKGQKTEERELSHLEENDDIQPEDDYDAFFQETVDEQIPYLEPENDSYDKGYTRLPFEGEVILNNLNEALDEWTVNDRWSEFFQEQKEHDKNAAERILKGAISSLGEEAVAINCERHAQELHRLFDRILYGSDGRSGETIQTALTEFSAIVWGRMPTVQESMSFSDWEMEDDE